MTPTDDEELFNRLLEFARNAAIVKHREVQLRTGRPERGHCHANVDCWVAENSGDKAVRGWLFSAAQFDKHSVVRGIDGMLFDVTPLDYPTRFFPHPGPDVEFERLRDQIPVPPLIAFELSRQ